MAEEGMGLHSQSDLVADAIREYLEKRGIEIPSADRRTNSKMIEFVAQSDE